MLDTSQLQYPDLYSFELKMDCFEKILDNTSSSYSFYWLEAILNRMIDQDILTFDAILDEMMALAYEDVIVAHYHLGPFIHGKRTNALENAILKLHEFLPPSCSKQEILICIKQHDKDMKEYKKLLIMQTPYRLLSSFLEGIGGNDPIWNRPSQMIQAISKRNQEVRLPYIIEDGKGIHKKVVVQMEWKNFLLTNYRLIIDWIHEEKYKYLEKREVE